MSVASIVSSQKNFFQSNRTKDLSFRRESLEKLLNAVKENESLIYAALESDLGKSKPESYFMEYHRVIREIRQAIQSLTEWSKPNRQKTPFFLFPAKSYVVNEPYGVVLIIAPWNDPFSLSMLPLIGAIAAGNCAIVKTSKNSPKTSSVITMILNGTFESGYIYSVDANSSYNDLFSCVYDYIFFTGSERVGRIIMRTASETLTPVTLELGGKNPCIIDQSANIKSAAKRIIWGKIINAGQSCVSPDYVVLPSAQKDAFIKYAKQYILQFTQDALENDSYPHIVDLHHFIRLRNLIVKEHSVIGGKYNEKTFKIEPAIFPDASFESDCMKDEIFGPILPIITYDDLDEVIDKIKQRQKPLACYLFAKDSSFLNKITSELSFGSGCVNDTMLQLFNDNLPFGGIGKSGMGLYHGKYTFETFSHKKSILINRNFSDFTFRFPPYTDQSYRKMHRKLKQ